MKAGSPVFIDTNVLVYAAVEDSPFHLRARQMMEACFASSAPVWISRQVIREYMAIMTRQPPNIPVIPMATTAKQVLHFQSLFRIAEDGPAVTENLLELVQRFPVAGKQIPTMRAYNIDTLLTLNYDDFRRFEDRITILTPDTAP